MRQEQPGDRDSLDMAIAANGDTGFGAEEEAAFGFIPDGSEAQEGDRQEEEATTSSSTMQELLDGALEMPRFRRGDFVRGVVVGKTDSEILIDIGAKSEGVVAGREFERLGPAGVAAVRQGDEVLAYVLRPEDSDGRVLLSLTRAQLERDWRKVEQLYNSGEAIERTVAGVNKGGVIVRLGRVRGFVPASQLSREHRGNEPERPIPPTPAPAAVEEAEEAAIGEAEAEIETEVEAGVETEAQTEVPTGTQAEGEGEEGEEGGGEERWAHLIGEKLLLKVVEVDRRRNRLILSERAAAREYRKQRKEELIDQLAPGLVLEGRVSTLCSFGAFIDLGGADGLVHLSELAWQHVKHPSEVLRVGQKVRVQVLSVDRDRKRIGLSIKRLEPEPWETVGDRYTVGQLVEGTVTKITDFGAFAQLEDGIEGLIHVSELSDQRVRHPSEVVKEGDKVTLRVIRVEPEKRRIGLSLKRVTDPGYVDMDWQFAEEFDDWDVDLDEE
ncbi:MAG: 30S ribosomal protein S1 [Anaerolineae bacterium]